MVSEIEVGVMSRCLCFGAFTILDMTFSFNYFSAIFLLAKSYLIMMVRPGFVMIVH